MALRVIVSGFGFMGQTHCGNLLNDPDADLVGIVDPCDPAERLASLMGNRVTTTITPEAAAAIPHYTTLSEAIGKAEADAAVIAVPTRFHAEAVMECLNGGLHVFVEKPFSISLEECRSMCTLAEARGKILSVGYVVRYTPEYELLTETIRSQRLGKLRFLKLARFTGVPRWGNWSDPAFVRFSGGALFDLVSHDIDFSRFCLGEPEEIETVPSLCREFSGNLTTAVLRFSGVNVFVEGGFVTPSAYPFQCSYTAFFEQGTLRCTLPGKPEEISNDGTITQVLVPAADPYERELRVFIQDVLKGERNSRSSGKDAMKSVECCVKIQEQGR